MKCWCVGQGALARFPGPFNYSAKFSSGIPLFVALKTSAFPRRDVGCDWALERAHLWQNGVEHLERSGKLRGRAVVDNENEGGGRSLEMAFLFFDEKSGIKDLDHRNWSLIT